MKQLAIEISTGPKAGQLIALTKSGLVFGRSDASDIVFGWDQVASRRHFTIVIDDDRALIQDLDSRNGTRVNGETISHRVLQVGDRIQIGKTICYLREVAPGQRIAPIVNQAADYQRTINSRSMAMEGPTMVNELEAAPRVNLLDMGRQIAAKAQSITSELRVTSRSDSVMQAAGNTQLHDSFDQAAKLIKQTANEKTVQPSLKIDSVRLKIVSQSEYGKLTWLSPGQTTVFGRSKNADYCIASDPSISNEHFRIKIEEDQCLVEDLESHTGTWVNGKKISQCQLQPGDRVRFGSIELLVEFQTSLNKGVPPVIADAEQECLKTKSTLGSFEISRQISIAGNIVHTIGTAVESDRLAELITDLKAEDQQIYLLVDFQRTTLNVPADLDIIESMLFGWTPASSISRTPLLLQSEEFDDLENSIAELWGCDALLVLYSRLCKSELLKHLRALVVQDEKRVAFGKGIVGICWPSVLSPMLLANAKDYIEDYFVGVDAALMEVPEGDGVWQLFDGRIVS